MSVANLLTSLLIVLISYVPCISNQDYMSTEKKKKIGRMNSACEYKHQFFSQKEYLLHKTLPVLSVF